MMVATAAVGTKRTAVGQCRREAREAGCGGCLLRRARRIAARCGLLRAVSHHSPLRKIIGIYTTHSCLAGKNKASLGISFWGQAAAAQKYDLRLSRRGAAIGRGRGLAEHPLEDRVDVLEMIAEVEIFLELGGAEVLAHILVGCEQRAEVAFALPGPHGVAL